MTTTGITTAIAVLPAAERPPLFVDLLLFPPTMLAPPVDEEEAAPDEVPVGSTLADVARVGVVVLVRMTVEGGCGVPFEVAVTTEVKSCVVGGTDGATTDEVTMGAEVVGVVACVVGVVVVEVVGSRVVVVSDVEGVVVTAAIVSTGSTTA
jgi:hypothetical protein